MVSNKYLEIYLSKGGFFPTFYLLSLCRRVLKKYFDPYFDKAATLSYSTLTSFLPPQEATDVLETLLDEDDEVPDVWYLLGWANYLHGKDYYNNARHYLAKAKEVCMPA